MDTEKDGMRTGEGKTEGLILAKSRRRQSGKKRRRGRVRGSGDWSTENTQEKGKEKTRNRDWLRGSLGMPRMKS